MEFESIHSCVDISECNINDYDNHKLLHFSATFVESYETFWVNVQGSHSLVLAREMAAVMPPPKQEQVMQAEQRDGPEATGSGE